MVEEILGKPGTATVAAAANEQAVNQLLAFCKPNDVAMGRQ